MSQSTTMDEPSRRCHVTMDTTPGMEHASDCKARHAAKRNGLDVRFRRDCVRRMVAMLEAAGRPIYEWEIHERLRENGGVRDWFDVCAMAMEEGLVERRDDIMFDLPIKLPRMSPERLAELDAFLKAQRLGVVVQPVEDFVITDRRHDGLLTKDEMDMVEMHVASCNALGEPEAENMLWRFAIGEIPYEEYSAFRSVVCARARKRVLRAQGRA